MISKSTSVESKRIRESRTATRKWNSAIRACINDRHGEDSARDRRRSIPRNFRAARSDMMEMRLTSSPFSCAIVRLSRGEIRCGSVTTFRSRAALCALLVGATLGVKPSAAAPGDAVTPAPTPSVAIPKVPIGISNLLVRLDSRDDIGLAGADYKIHLIERMRERGFAAVGAENLVFDKDESRRAEFRVGGIVRELDCRETRMGTNCGLAVEWQLLDVARDAVVYKVLTRGTVLGVAESNRSRIAAMLLLNAFDSLLVRGRFRAALTASTSGRAVSDPTFPSTTFARCASITKRMPEGAEQILNATVVVRSKNGFGSGFFISADGLVVTAAHVLEGTSVTLRMRDGVEIAAVPVRVAWRTDAALLRPSHRLTGVPCLAPAAAEPAMGTELYVAGAPAKLELAFSLTRGIVSALRERDGIRVLQTDAPVSPGNSGGPMVDSNGAAVAVTSSKLAGGAVEGVGFGVPIGTALAALGVAPGNVTDPWLHDGPAMTKPEARHEEAFEDVADPIVSLDPDADRALAADRQRRAALAVEEAKRKDERDRADAREQATPTYLKVFRWGGLSLAASGAVVAAVSFASYDSATTKQPTFDSLRMLNTVGWIGVGLGGAGFLASYLFRPSLAPAKTGTAPSVQSFSVGVGGVRLDGTF